MRLFTIRSMMTCKKTVKCRILIARPDYLGDVFWPRFPRRLSRDHVVFEMDDECGLCDPADRPGLASYGRALSSCWVSRVSAPPSSSRTPLATVSGCTPVAWATAVIPPRPSSAASTASSRRRAAHPDTDAAPHTSAPRTHCPAHRLP